MLALRLARLSGRATQTAFPFSSSSTLLASAAAQEAFAKSADTASRAFYSAFVGQGFCRTVYFGDTHVQSSGSTDAGLDGTIPGAGRAYRCSCCGH